jgi:hypothetical protein
MTGSETFATFGIGLAYGRHAPGGAGGMETAAYVPDD